jgi:hypothetical protein
MNLPEKTAETRWKIDDHISFIPHTLTQPHMQKRPKPPVMSSHQSIPRNGEERK